MRHSARATHVWKQGFGRSRELRAGNFVGGGFVAGARNVLFDDDEPRVGPSGASQMLQDFEAIFVRPVVENHAEKENCDVFLSRGLRVKETEALRNPNVSAHLCASGWPGWDDTDRAASRGRNRARRAGSFSNTALKMHQEEVHMKWELMPIAPRWHRRAHPRDLVQRNEGEGGFGQLSTTASQRRLQHRPLGSQEGAFPMQTL